MSDYLTSLATRALLPSGDVQPQLLSLFEPERAGDEPLREDDAPSPVAGLEEPASEVEPSREPKRGLSAAPITEVRAMAPPVSDSPTPSAQSLPPDAADRGVPREVVVEREVRREIAAGREASVEPMRVAEAVAEERRVKADEVKEFSRATPAPVARIATATNPRAATEPASADNPPPAIVPAQLPPNPIPVRVPRESARHFSERHREPEPRVIQISIGRLEIRAATSTPAPRPNAARPDARAMTLDEYLRDKAAGGRR